MSFPTGYRLILIIVTLTLANGCSTDSGPSGPGIDGRWQQAGLSGTAVNTIQAEEGVLFAGTDRGVFKRNADPAEVGWVDLGLQSDTSIVKDMVLWNDRELMAVLNYDNFKTEISTLYKSTNGGQDWELMNITYPEINAEVNAFNANDIEQYPGKTDELLAAVGRIMISTDKGKNWEKTAGGGNSEFLTVTEDHPGHIWTGGQNNIFGPYLEKSEDGGETWTKLNRNINTGSDGRVMDALLHPEDPDRVLVAMGFIRRTSDGGQIWEDVPAQGVFVFRLIHSIRHAGVVYAGGINEDEKVVFAQSPDFGDTWQIVAFEDGPTGIRINDLVAVEQNDREVLYFATNQGVSSYTFEE